MPTYSCTAAAGLLSDARKNAIAVAITRAHSEITGAPPYFAQILFHDMTEGNQFIGGQPLGHDHVFVDGTIRSGRSVRDREALIKRLVEDVAKAANVPRFSVWVYLTELPPDTMAEFGHILPPPGEEEAWSDSLPEADRLRMQNLGEGR